MVNKIYEWDENGFLKYTQDTAAQDQTTEVNNLYFSRSIQSAVLTLDTTLDDTSITITSVAEPTNGNIVCIKEGTRFYQGFILSHSANVTNWDLTLDTPLDFAFTTDATLHERSTNMAVNGSVTTVEFSVSPKFLTNVKWDIYDITGSLLDETDMDDGLFGGMTALTKGLVFRLVNGITKNYFNAKTNLDLKLNCNVEYSSKAPSGQYGMRFIYDIVERNGVAIRLDADEGGEFKILIQDDLRNLVDFKVKVHGHTVED